ncbi:MAG: hypothetical protein OEM99_18075, partial [Gammaproteobacteria bacterium]|nr:hypothetical protein [Gammaproteobacteria bacterium]
MSLHSELRRRNVFGMVVLYVVGAWLVVQVAESIFQGLGIPESSIRYVWIAAAVGLPIALIFSWRFDVTTKGIKRTPSFHDGATGLPLKTADHVLLVGLSAVAIATVAVLTQEILETQGDGLVPPIVGAFEPPEKSIGVLPFENMSDDPEQAWFSAGVAVELSDRLAQIKVLKVIARETMKIFERPVDVGEVAREVNAKYVLDGSVRRSGDRLRITVQLVNGTDNTQVWTHSYDEELTSDNLFDIQTQIANAIASRMQITISQAQQSGSAPTASISAYDAYLQARELMNLRSSDSLAESVRYLERALGLDDNFAPAHAQLAMATMFTRGSRQIPWEELREDVVAHLDRAEELQPGMAETYAGQSLLAARNGDLETAVKWAQRALEINPSYVDAMNFLQGIYRRLGRHEESESILVEMLSIDPLNVAARVNYMEVLHESGRCEEAHDHADLLIPRSPGWGYGMHSGISYNCDGEIAGALFWDMKLNFSGGGWVFALVGEYAEVYRKADDHARPFLLVMEGRIDEGIELVDRRVRLDPKTYAADVDTGDLYYFVRSFDKAQAIYERAFERAPAGRPISGNMPVIKTMRLAYIRRINGDEAGAQEIAAIARDEYAKRYAAGKRNGDIYLSAGMIAAFDNEPQRAIAALRTGVHDSSLRLHIFLDEPVFDALRNEPGFIEV